MKVLVVNAGSSSLKYQLFDTESGNVLAKGNCERIGIDHSRLLHKTADGRECEKEIPMEDHTAAIRLVAKTLVDPAIGCLSSIGEIGAVGHRVVHGGPYFSESAGLLGSSQAFLNVEFSTI